jgi:hypothetical protein
MTIAWSTAPTMHAVAQVVEAGSEAQHGTEAKKYESHLSSHRLSSFQAIRQGVDEARQAAALVRVERFVDFAESTDPRAAQGCYVGERCLEGLFEREGVEGVIRQRGRDAVLGFLQAWPQGAKALP